jgi:hypothetical protein
VERQEFVETEPGSWWFTEPSPDRRWHQARLELGEARGWTDPSWFTERTKIEELYRALENQAPQLLKDLDYLIDDYQRIAWVQSAQQALNDPPRVPTPETPVPTAAPPVPVAKDQRRAEAAVAQRPRARLFTKKGADGPPDPAPEAIPDPIPDTVPAHVSEGVSRVLESLSGENTAELAAELGLTEEDLAALAHDPDFQRMVHEEAARLHLGQATA